MPKAASAKLEKGRAVNGQPVKVQDGKLRRLALAQQGLLRNNSFGSLENTIRQIGYIQIDTISVVERAHHHVLWSRLSKYQPDQLSKLISQKKIFEYWFHAAAFLPIDDFRFALPKMHAIKSGEKHWFENIDRKLIRSVRRRIETEGPLRARDFADTRKTNTGWWDWKPAKQALEKLFMQGDLMVVGREGFQKRYDLTENVLPAHIDTRVPDIDEQALHLIGTNIRAHGFASLKSFTYLRKGKQLRASVKEQLNSLLEQKKLILIQSSSCEQYYTEPDMLDRKLRVPGRVKLLSPFDNLVIQRARCREIFNFDYQIECYVPQPKRQYGYFCLPILYKDRLIGRADIKAVRKERLLSVINLQLDSDDDLTDDLINSLTIELKEFMSFNACDSIAVERAANKRLKSLLQASLKK